MRPRRRRLPRAALLGALLAAACDAGAHPTRVAHAGDWALSTERLADLLVLGQPMDLDPATVSALVDHWIAMAAFAQRTAAGADLQGPDAMAASLWLERREALLEAERRFRLGDALRVGPDRARLEFRADTLRLLLHVLRRTGPSISARERDLQRRTVQGILDGLLRGGSWLEAVRQSEDDSTRDAAGLLGLLRIDELPPELSAAAARLLPGQVSAVVESPQGFHILHRPRYEDVAELYASLLSARLAARADSSAIRALEDSLDIRIHSERLDAIRTFARESEPAATMDGPLAVWAGGGALEGGTAARHVAALPADARARLLAAPDEAIHRFVEQLAVREARLEIAAAAGLEADSATLRSLEEMHRSDVERWLTHLSGAAGPTRESLDRYMERLVSRQTPVAPVAPLLRKWLLEPFAWSHDLGAQAEAVAAAHRLIDAAEGGVRQ